MYAAEMETLFRRYGRHVQRRAVAILGDGDAARDVVQEVFARALHTRTELPGIAASVTWLYRVTTNLCLSGMRERSRRRRILDRWGPRPGRPVAAQAVDSAITVRALLRDVPDDLLEIAVYYFVDEMSQSEIAALTGIPRRTVAHRLKQFRVCALKVAADG
jgi:RNA polymerase sigma factor (sigma-70 family)